MVTSGAVTKMRNIKIVIQYDGACYHGWQIQSQHVTVQGTLLEVIHRMTNDDSIKLVGASRTDTGVHALGQVGNFRLPERVSITCPAFFHGLNCLTPHDIIVTDVQEAHPDFHARFDARGKTYCYQIENAPTPSMYHQRFAWHIRQALDIAGMRQAARHLIGCHDFASFQAASCSAETSIRTVFGLHVQQKKSLVRIYIRANAYLHHMVRNIVGTLVEIGMKKRTPDEMRCVLSAKDRTIAGQTAPGHGLFLVKVHY